MRIEPFALILLVTVLKALAWYQDILVAKLQYSMPENHHLEGVTSAW